MCNINNNNINIINDNVNDNNNINNINDNVILM